MPTFKACKDVHGALLEEELAKDGPWGFLGGDINHTSWETTFPGGSRMQWFGAREANAARGIRTDVGTFDECDDIDSSVIDGVSDPWFSEPWSLRILLFGGTPRRGRYGLLHREHQAGLVGERARSLGRALDTLPLEDREHLAAFLQNYSFHATYRDAPETVDQAYVAKIKAKTQRAIFAREWECDFDSAEGLVYGHFDQRIHLKDPDPKAIPTEVLVGVDHGWEDPGVFVVIFVFGSGKDAVSYVVEEVYEQHQLESWWIEQAKRIRAKYPKATWYMDPSRPDRVQALKDGALLHVGETNNAIEDGVSAVGDRFGARPDPDDPRRDDDPDKRRLARLYVSPRCAHTLFEIANYKRKRDPRNADRFLEHIEDKQNHSMDALRYAVFSRFGRPEAARGVGQYSIGIR